MATYKRVICPGTHYAELDLLVSHYVPSADKWVCYCGSCGEEFLLTAKRLHTMRKSPCKRCYAKQTLLAPGSRIPVFKWNRILDTAADRNIAVSVTPADLWEVFLEQYGQCALTGDHLWFHTHHSDRYNDNTSLDRINNDLGYTRDNVQWVTKTANQIKSDHCLEKIEEFSVKFLYTRTSLH